MFTNVFNNIDFDKATDFIKENGYLIINNFFSKSQCDEYVAKTINAFQTINPELDHTNKDKWKSSDLPPQTRTGMFQFL